MPTSVARLGREKRIATLARNVFVIEGPDKANQQRRAERALLKANPQLATEADFTAGASVIVPSVRGLRTTDRVSTTTAELDGLLADAAVRLAESATLIEIGFARSAKRSEEALARLDDREFVATARKAVKESAKLMTSVRKRLVQDSETADARNATLKNAVKRALADVDRLSKLARSAPTS